MLPNDRLTIALEIHATSFRLLKWVAEAVAKGFIPATRAHQYANDGDSAREWVVEHFENLPRDCRPDRARLREFGQFFGTYLTSSFDIVEQPGLRRVDPCGCGCRFCSYLTKASHLRPKKTAQRHKDRARRLMEQRLVSLAFEEGIQANEDDVRYLCESDEARRYTAYSAYGYWLIRRLDGETDGTSILALWREMAWTRQGSPMKNFKLRIDDIRDAESNLVLKLRSLAEKRTSG
jgi:hypothetical protein